MQTGITFGDFTRLANKNGFTEESLVEICRPWWSGHDRIESFAKRVFLPMYKDVVIPYQALLELAARWQSLEVYKKGRTCACGCGKIIVSQFRQYASAACRQRNHRQNHFDIELS